ncbi:MAG: sel1 repeat family protein [Gammaproteobacteria bacterium]|jgi:hypothetical protein|nr:sel1 repeat family protein [Gammaproteobacteria bacterium]
MADVQERLQEAQEALRRGDYPRALATLTPLAEGGEAVSQYRLGILHANAEGVPLDYVKAAHWLRRAAEQGYARAQSILAWLYATGYGVEQDDRQAGEWYLRAAEQGLPKDQYTVAAMYRWGRYGVQRDPAEMLRWYERAANQGFAPAQYALGQLLARGEEIPGDERTAFQWLSLAIVNGSEVAKKALMELTARMTPEQIETAKRQMLEMAHRVAGVEDAPRRDVGHLL